MTAAHTPAQAGEREALYRAWRRTCPKCGGVGFTTPGPSTSMDSAVRCPLCFPWTDDANELRPVMLEALRDAEARLHTQSANDDATGNDPIQKWVLARVRAAIAKAEGI